MRRLRGRAIVSFLALGGALSSLPVPAAVRLDPRYVELLDLYARGERSQALAALGEWNEGALRKQLAIVQEARLAAERCPRCPDRLAKVPLRAAVMLHSDRDQAERPDPSGREQLPRCPGPHARIAEAYAATLARDPASRDFARRFFLATALRWQLDACFEDAGARARAGLDLFGKDAELLLARGSVREERATLFADGEPGSVASLRRDWLEEARRDLADAVSADPDLVLARIRLGRVLWRLGQADEAREALESALARGAADPRDLYLAHLFLGRVHEDAQRLEEAAAQYRQAFAIDPAQSAAVALARALQLGGALDEARQVMARGLVVRPVRDAYWDYLVSNARRTDELLYELRREALE